MHKTNFELIASILRNVKPNGRMTDSLVRMEQWRRTVEAFATALQETSQRFNHVKFFMASGYER